MINTIKKLFGIGPSANFKELVQAGAVIWDVRSPAEFKGGHAHGAINVPLDKLNEYAQKQKNKEQTIITCCASGMRSANAKGVLERAGFSHVYNGGPWSKVNF
jgi:phage shock protein E